MPKTLAPSRGCCALGRRHKSHVAWVQGQKGCRQVCKRQTDATATQICTDESDMAQVRRMLSADPVWAAYPLADLQPEYCCGLSLDDGEPPAAGDAIALVYRGFDAACPVYDGRNRRRWRRFSHRRDLPDAVYLTIGESHLPVVSCHYAIEDVRPMRRMVLADTQAAVRGGMPGAEEPAIGATRLTGACAPDVLQLLAHGGPFAPDAFSPAQMDRGVFFGHLRR